jgi:excisionase family DNA binding protein
MSPPAEEFVSVGEAARILGVSRRTVLRWIRDERIPSEVTESGDRQVRREDLKRVIASSREEGSNDDED